MTFVAWLLNLLASIGLKLWQNAPSPPEVVEGEKAGAATQALSDVETSDAKAQTAAVAATAVAASVATPAGLLNYEAHDPNNRDGNA